MWLTNKATKDIQNDEIILTIPQATSYSIQVQLLNDKGEKIEPASGFVAKFTIKKRVEDSTPALQKDMIEGTDEDSNKVLELQLTPQETQSLSEGRYVFDVMYAEGTNIYQVVPISHLKVEPSLATVSQIIGE